MAAKAPVIHKSTFDFLKKLMRNNNREWFAANKLLYEAEHEKMIAFAEHLLGLMQKHDMLENTSGKKTLYRIYRDTRFSTDKTPYKNHWAGGFRRATAQRRGGYYFHLEPGGSFAAGGFWGPNPEDLLRIRRDILLNPDDWQQLMSNKRLRKTFGNLQGEQMKTAPRGFAKDLPCIEDIRRKQFLFIRKFSDAEVLSTGFARLLNQTFMDLRPFFDYMSMVLTSDANGNPA